jgi:hypothetical protein
MHCTPAGCRGRTPEALQSYCSGQMLAACGAVKHPRVLPATDARSSRAATPRCVSTTRAAITHSASIAATRQRCSVHALLEQQQRQRCSNHGRREGSEPHPQRAAPAEATQQRRAIRERASARRPARATSGGERRSSGVMRCAGAYCSRRTLEVLQCGCSGMCWQRAVQRSMRIPGHKLCKNCIVCRTVRRSSKLRLSQRCCQRQVRAPPGRRHRDARRQREQR